MSDGPSWDGVGDTLGKDFHITRLTFKNHVGCGHTFAAIDAALALREGADFNIRDASRIHVYTYRPALDIACYGKPASSNEARFSLRYVVAHALVHGSVRLNAYDDERVHDPVLGALIDRIDVHADPDIDAAFPANRSARIDIELTSGERRVHFQANRKGDPEDPLSDASSSQSSSSLQPHAWGPRRQRKSWRIFGASISAPICATWLSRTYNCWSKSILDRLEAAKIECLQGRDRTSAPFAVGTRNLESAVCAADELYIPGWRQHEVQSTSRVPARKPGLGRPGGSPGRAPQACGSSGK